MKNRFTLFRRGKVFYFEDREAKVQKSLGTKNLDEARKIVQTKNDAVTLNFRSRISPPGMDPIL